MVESHFLEDVVSAASLDDEESGVVRYGVFVRLGFDFECASRTCREELRSSGGYGIAGAVLDFCVDEPLVRFIMYWGMDGFLHLT